MSLVLEPAFAVVARCPHVQRGIEATLMAGGMDVVALRAARMAEIIGSEAAYNEATVKKQGFKPD